MTDPQLKIVREVPLGSNRVPLVECKCTCGKRIFVCPKQFEQGKRTSCGCRRKKIITRYEGKEQVIAYEKMLDEEPNWRLEKKVSNIEIGDTFGDLKVVDYAGVSSRRYHLFLCKCKCKKRDVIPGIMLYTGKAVRCAQCQDYTSSKGPPH